MRPFPQTPNPQPPRYSSIHVAECEAAGGLVAVKVYDQPALSAKKQRMAMREAIVLKYLHACG